MARNPKNTRMCASCRTRCDKSQFIRVTKTKDGIVVTDATSHVEGRSIYLCTSEKCIDTAIKKKAISRGLKCEIDPEIFERIQKALKTE